MTDPNVDDADEAMRATAPEDDGDLRDLAGAPVPDDELEEFTEDVEVSDSDLVLDDEEVTL
jgi:hypothetical protein